MKRCLMNLREGGCEMQTTWESMYENLLLEIRNGNYKKLSDDLKSFDHLWDEVYDLINNAMGSEADDFEKILRQAEKMMEPYDPEKTFYKKELYSQRWKNGAARFRKENPDRDDVIVN